MTTDDMWFVHDLRQAADMGGTIIDGSAMRGAQSYDLHFAAVADGRLEHVVEPGQVPFFRLTDKGRAWIGLVAS